MYFSLEVMQANHGDCLLLHFGSKQNPEVIVIDGGPSGIFENVLKPRLLEIKENHTPAEKLPLSMIMVSHIDDDHANGVCMLMDELVADGNAADFDAQHLWVNTFDDIIGNLQLPAIAKIGAASSAASISEIGIPGIKKIEKQNHHVVAVIASTSQGRQLRDNAKALSISVNHPFREGGNSSELVRGDIGDSKVTWDQGLKINVVCPDDKRLKKLQEKWDKDLKKAKQKGDDSIIFASITSLDTSPFNLSSIVCLVEFQNKKILLTGDARSDDILEGLKKNNLLNADGKLHVDVLKMPHHGSNRNMEKSFLQKVTADHYVISANGAFENPDGSLLDMMADTVKNGTVHITNRKGKLHIEKDIKNFSKKIVDEKSKLKVEFIAAGENSMVIDLLESIDF